MALVLTTPPALEPVTLAEAKTHLRVTHADEDALITSLIVAARRQAELASGMAFIAQGWSYYLDRWPREAHVEIPLAPLIGIDDVFVYGEDDVGASIDTAHYYADTASRPPRLVRRTGRGFPIPGRAANGIEIVFQAGFGAAAANVPETLRQAVLMLAAHYYEHRGDESVGPPLTFEAAVQPYRRARL
jgi:uncharacterized phiE125 gp8 family phage protein